MQTIDQILAEVMELPAKTNFTLNIEPSYYGEGKSNVRVLFRATFEDAEVEVRKGIDNKNVTQVDILELVNAQYVNFMARVRGGLPKAAYLTGLTYQPSSDEVVENLFASERDV